MAITHSWLAWSLEFESFQPVNILEKKIVFIPIIYNKDAHVEKIRVKINLYLSFKNWLRLFGLKNMCCIIYIR